jgi:CRISPR-associated protein Csx14
MSQKREPTIRLRVDLTNPGQFFACCGLLELADRIWSGVEAWFDCNIFLIFAEEPAASLHKLLKTAHDIQLAEDLCSAKEDEDEEEVNSVVNASPLVIESPISLRLDWWKDKTLKTWAGSMDARKIFLAMCNAIDTQNEDPLNQGLVVFDATVSVLTDARSKRSVKPKKREPFYFDSRRGANAWPIDVGFSTDSLKLTTIAYPVVEGLALVGLQRCRPKPTDTPRVFEYFTWRIPLPVEVVPLAVLGLVGDGKGYRFENAFRTDQKKHKAYTPATCIGGE